MDASSGPYTGRPRWLLPAALAGLALVAVALALAAPAAAAPPFAAIAKPVNLAHFEACQSIDLDGSTSIDPEGSPMLFIWTLPNETVQGMNLSSFSYGNLTTVGNYTITLTVRDAEALEDNVSVSITIDTCNLPPVAVIAEPADGRRFFTDEAINFSAWGSYDPDGTIGSYTWLFNGIARGGLNVSVSLQAGVQNVTLSVTDDRGKVGQANITVLVEVNQPPAAAAGAVTPLVGFAGGSFTFSFTYSDANNESAQQALLLVDGSPHAMVLEAGGNPQAGQSYSLRLALPAGRHAFYFLAFDGNLTNISASTDGPDVFENITRLSGDGLALFQITALPPSVFAVSVASEGALLPGDPPSMEAVSLPYAVQATALAASNFSLSIGFTPTAGIDPSSALVMRFGNVSWQPLVTDTDATGHTASITGEFRDLPTYFRVFARRAAALPNEPAVPQIAHQAAGGEYYPNSTIRFDASGSTDPENATLLFAWRFIGPGVSTGWIAGPTVMITFPAAGFYSVELRVDDGSGAPVTKATTLEIRDRPAPVVDVLEEPLALAGLAGAVAVSALLAIWWRGRGPIPKRKYDDQYGALYTRDAMEEKEYAQLFEKFAVSNGEEEPPEVVRGEK